MAVWLLIVRIVAPIVALIALYRFVLYGEWLQSLLIVFIWFIVHFILMTMNARDTEWVRQGEQIRLQALRDKRDDWQRWEQDLDGR